MMWHASYAMTGSSSRNHPGVIDEETIRRTQPHAFPRPVARPQSLRAKGWVGLGKVVAALWSGPGWGSAGVVDIEGILAVASKQRHKIHDGRIRVIYGHSLPERIERTPTTPPDLLYYGTFPDNLERMMHGELPPMSR